MFFENTKFSKKSNANNKRSITIFVNKILHLNPINNKKQVVKQNIAELKYELDTRTSDVEETETEGDDDDSEFNNGDDDDDDDDDDDNGDVEMDDAVNNNGYNNGDGEGYDGNCVEGVTVNEDLSNIKHLTGET